MKSTDFVVLSRPNLAATGAMPNAIRVICQHAIRPAVTTRIVVAGSAATAGSPIFSPVLIYDLPDSPDLVKIAIRQS